MKSPEGLDSLWRPGFLATFLALLVLNAAVFAAYTLPHVLQERTLSLRVAALREDVERQERLRAKLQRRADTLAANARDLERFYRDVVKDRKEGLLPVLEDLERTADELGLTRASRDYQPSEVEGAPLERVSINIPVEGTYKQLVSYLNSLERSPHFLTVDQIHLREGGGAQGGALNIVLSAYFRSGSRR